MIDLPRNFFYQDRETINEFRDESQLWRDLYKTFILVKDNYLYKRISPSPLAMLNEVYYQCKRVVMDKNPEEDISGSYWNVVRDDYGSNDASELCFSMVYAVLMLQKSRPFNVDLFCKALRQNFLDEEEFCFYNFKEMVDSCIELGKDKYETDFTPNPCSPDKFDVEEWTPDSSGHYVLTPKYNSHWWKTETANFDQNKIREIVNVWQTKEDRIAVLDRIERAFDDDESLPF